MDIQVQSVLADRGAPVVVKRDLVIVEADELCERVDDRQLGGLHYHRGELVRLEHPLPRIGVLRLAPAQLSHRRLRVGYAAVNLHLAVLGVHAGQLALRDLYDPGLDRVFGADGGDRSHGREGDDKYHREDGEPAEPAASAKPPRFVRERGLAQDGKSRGGEHGERPADHRVLIEFKYRQHQKQQYGG